MTDGLLASAKFTAGHSLISLKAIMHAEIRLLLVSMQHAHCGGTTTCDPQTTLL